MTDGHRRLAGDLALGFVAGAAATWVMDKVTTVLYARESNEAKERENAARGGRTAYEIAAEKGAGLVGAELTEEQRQWIGGGIHWALGASAGAGYGLVRNRIAAAGLGSGLAYGAVFWLAMDEGALTVLGISPPPQEFPWQTHVRGLIGHLVLGAAIEAAFDIVDLAADS